MITRYEIAARHPDGRAFLIAYTPRVSRNGLLDAMRSRGDVLINKLAIGEQDQIMWSAKPRPHAETSGWWIGFTGRTQLDAKQSALPYIGD